MIRYPCEVSLTNVFKDLAVTCFTVFNGPLNMIGYVEKKSYFYSASLAILNIKVYMIYLAYVFYVQIVMLSSTNGEKKQGFFDCHNSLIAVYKSAWNVLGHAEETLRKL